MVTGLEYQKELRYLLRNCCGHGREHGLLSQDLGLRCCVEVLPQVEQGRLIPNELQYLRLTIHHVLVFEDLLDGHDFTSCFNFSLHKDKIKELAGIQKKMA